MLHFVRAHWHFLVGDQFRVRILTDHLAKTWLGGDVSDVQCWESCGWVEPAVGLPSMMVAVGATLAIALRLVDENE